MACMAYEVTEEDILHVLQEFSLRVTDTKGKSFRAMAEELIEEVDHDRVQKAALAAGNRIDAQTQGAFDEIKDILVELGAIDF